MADKAERDTVQAGERTNIGELIEGKTCAPVVLNPGWWLQDWAKGLRDILASRRVRVINGSEARNISVVVRPSTWAKMGKPKTLIYGAGEIDIVVAWKPEKGDKKTEPDELASLLDASENVAVLVYPEGQVGQ